MKKTNSENERHEETAATANQATAIAGGWAGPEWGGRGVVEGEGRPPVDDDFLQPIEAVAGAGPVASRRRWPVVASAKQKRGNSL